jgi:catechol 2,3-dioxygenase-like lactoylglutathione lyase family enzyme
MTENARAGESFAFDHAAQVVPDIAAAVEWYRGTLPGVSVLYQDDTWAFIRVGNVKLAFVVRDQHPGHLAWRVPQAELERLAAEHGKEIKPHRDGTKSFYLEAPGGQSIEIISYEGSRWEADEANAGGDSPPAS